MRDTKNFEEEIRSSFVAVTITIISEKTKNSRADDRIGRNKNKKLPKLLKKLNYQRIKKLADRKHVE